MKKSYPGNWAFSPLMLDLEYTFQEEKQTSSDSLLIKGKEQIIRIANTDVIGQKQIAYALTKIKGIGINFANFVCTAASINRTKKAGILNEAEVGALNDVINNPL